MSQGDKMHTLELTEHGFLKDPNIWTEAIAQQLAKTIHIDLTAEHWQVICFLRRFYQQFQIIPPLRILIKNLKAEYGEPLGNSISIHKLFLENPLKNACLIAGLPKPKHCL